jgi:hypothetical protein
MSLSSGAWPLPGLPITVLDVLAEAPNSTSLSKTMSSPSSVESLGSESFSSESLGSGPESETLAVPRAARSSASLSMSYGLNFQLAPSR